MVLVPLAEKSLVALAHRVTIPHGGQSSAVLAQAVAWAVRVL